MATVAQTVRLSLAQPSCNIVEPKTLCPADGLALIAVKGGSEEEKLTTCAGIKAFARRLCQRRKAVVLKDDLRESSVESSPHDGSLAR